MAENIDTAQKLQSDLYGEIMVAAHQVYQFPEGLVGMSHLNKFALLPYEDTELFVLQAFQEDIGLLLLPAAMSDNNDGFYVDETIVEGLGVENSSEVIAFYILRFIDGQPYVNLKAPIIIVPNTQKGCQYVLTDDSVSVRERLILAGEADARS